jgi:hypothetical protein
LDPRTRRRRRSPRPLGQPEEALSVASGYRKLRWVGLGMRRRVLVALEDHKKSNTPRKRKNKLGKEFWRGFTIEFFLREKSCLYSSKVLTKRSRYKEKIHRNPSYNLDLGCIIVN